MNDDVIKNGLVGKLMGWRFKGKSFDADGKEVDEKHEEDCFCCRESLFIGKP
jgi:hypothetical protein